MVKVGIINCGISNLTSVLNAFRYITVDARVVDSPERLDDFSHIVLPGVGAFPKGMDNIRTTGFEEIIKLQVQKGKPILGICLGMQLLANEGEEFSLTPGLGIIPGRIKKVDVLVSELRLPHVGWNNVVFRDSCPLWNAVPDNSSFYFVHSYAYSDLAEEYVAGETHYGNKVIAAVSHENIFGVQFHPEKSQKVGLQLLKNFASIC